MKNKSEVIRDLETMEWYELNKKYNPKDISSWRLIFQKVAGFRPYAPLGVVLSISGLQAIKIIENE